MTRFEKDKADALAGNEIEVITRRRAELKRLENEGKSCKNAFRRLCIAQEYARLKDELDEIRELF